MLPQTVAAMTKPEREHSFPVSEESYHFYSAILYAMTTEHDSHLDQNIWG